MAGPIHPSLWQRMRAKLVAWSDENDSQQASLQSLALFPEENDSPILRVNEAGRIVYANKASKDLLAKWGVQTGERIPPQWLGIIKISLQQHEKKETEVDCGDKTYILNFIPIVLAHYVNIYATDISKRKYYEQQLAHMISHDMLTNLPNRNILEDRLQQLISFAKQANTHIAMMCLSLSDFKNLNNTYGHHQGDVLLKMAAERLRANLPETITVARIGGNKFGILESDIAHAEDAESCVATIIKIFNKSFQFNDTLLKLSVNIGVSLFPDDADQHVDLIKQADLAMYRARMLGHDNFQFYVKGLDATLSRRHTLMNDLWQAIDKQQLQVYYQGQYDLQTEKIVGFEALLRWMHPQLGVVSPTEFIYLAEESGFIIQMGYWVIKKACLQLKAWQDQGLIGCTMAVNVSPMQFNQTRFLESVSNIIGEAGIAPGQLEFEITENLMVHSPERVAGQMQAFNRLGVRFSIDDFGTGYSSLSYLQHLPISKIKIDRSFIINLMQNQDKQTLVCTIIQMGHNLGLKVLAEGVESKAQVNFLREQGCDDAQGFYYAKPLPPDEVVAST